MFERVSGKKIKQAIKESGYTQEKFAKKIKTDQSMISQWIIGKRNPKESSLKKIANATGKPLSYFIDDDSINASNIKGRGDIVVGKSNIIRRTNTIYNTHKSELLEKEMELLKRENEILKKEIELNKLLSKTRKGVK